MDRGTKILFAVIVLMILATIGVTYDRYFLRLDYAIISEVACDPQQASCFVRHCDWETEDCTGNPADDNFYFKKITRTAREAIQCAEEACVEACGEGEPFCTEEYCVPDSGDECYVEAASSEQDEEIPEDSSQ